MSTIHTHGRTPAPLADRVEALRRKHTLAPECRREFVWACGRPHCLHLTSSGAREHIQGDTTDAGPE